MDALEATGIVLADVQYKEDVFGSAAAYASAGFNGLSVSMRSILADYTFVEGMEPGVTLGVTLKDVSRDLPVFDENIMPGIALGVTWKTIAVDPGTETNSVLPSISLGVTLQ